MTSSKEVSHTAEFLHFKDVPGNILQQLADKSVMNQPVPDMTGWNIPPGFSQEDWQQYGLGDESDYYAQYPHPPTITYSECSGIDQMNIRAGHQVVLSLTTYKWIPNSQYGGPIPNVGIWSQDYDHQISDWIDKSQIPQTINYKGNLIPVEKSPSTTMCPSCSNIVTEGIKSRSRSR